MYCTLSSPSSPPPPPLINASSDRPSRAMQHASNMEQLEGLLQEANEEFVEPLAISRRVPECRADAPRAALSECRLHLHLIELITH